MNGTLRPISDGETAARLKKSVQPILDPPGHLSTEWLMKHHWVAVPVESASHFDDRDAYPVAAAMRRLELESCFAIASEELAEFPCCFEVDASSDGLLAFSKKCSLFNFIIVPEDMSFAVLCTVFDYYVVAGHADFVEAALGCSVPVARRKFAEMASRSHYAELLHAVAKRYEP